MGTYLYVDVIQQAVQDVKEGSEVYLNHHIGGINFIQVNSRFKVVDFRQFWLPYGKSKVQPTRHGIALKFEEFETLMKLDFEKITPELNKVVPCYDHMNPDVILTCKLCKGSFFSRTEAYHHLKIWHKKAFDQFGGFLESYFSVDYRFAIF